MENKDLSEKEKQSIEDWKMIKKHKPWYLRGNSVSHSQELEEYGKVKIPLNNFFYIIGLLSCIAVTIIFGFLGFGNDKNRGIWQIFFYVFIAVDLIVLIFAILNFVFNHVYIKQYKDVRVVLYCNWSNKVLEINKIQKDFGPFKKTMVHEVNNCIVTINGKNIDIKEKELGVA